MKNKTKEKDYLIIDRSKWQNGGHKNGNTALLNSNGQMCCLGFRCKDMGIPESDLIRNVEPENLRERWYIPDLINKNGRNSSFAEKAIEINDGLESLSERENALIEHFAKKDIIVEFTGKYNKDYLAAKYLNTEEDQKLINLK